MVWPCWSGSSSQSETHTHLRTETQHLFLSKRNQNTRTLKDFTATLITAPNWKQSICPSTGDRRSKLWSVPTVTEKRSRFMWQHGWTWETWGRVKKPHTKDDLLCDSVYMKFKNHHNQDTEKGTERTLPVGRHSPFVTRKWVRDFSGVTDISYILIAGWVTSICIHLSSYAVWGLKDCTFSLFKFYLNQGNSMNKYSPHDFAAQEGLRVTARPQFIKCLLSFPYSVKTFFLQAPCLPAPCIPISCAGEPRTTMSIRQERSLISNTSTTLRCW